MAITNHINPMSNCYIKLQDQIDHNDELAHEDDVIQPSNVNLIK